jgi:DegV family protein with EDD domain
MGRAYGIRVVPIYLLAEGQMYRDGVDLDAGTLYRLLRDKDHLPTSSQPTVDDFLQVYRSLSQQAEAIVSIHLSRCMSGTLDSALAAGQQLLDIPISVMDSRSISIGLGLIAIAAARACAAGQDAAQVVRLVEETIPRMNVIFTVETLDYLRKGGRIGGAAALLGSVLEIKPVLYVKDGRIELLERQRTRQRSIERIIKLMMERTGSCKRVYASVFHCAVPAEAQALADRVMDRFQGVELVVTEAGPIIGTHAGPGTLGVAFYTDE